MINIFPSTVNPFQGWRRSHSQSVSLQRPNLAVLAQNDAQLPQFVRDCPVAMKYMRLLGPLDWTHFPERPTDRPWPGPQPHPRAPFVAAYLVKLHQGHKYMSQLRDFLVEHPALVWVLGFKLVPSDKVRYGFDVDASVPHRKQLGRVLRDLHNPALQFLLDCTVDLLQQELPATILLGDEISLDTKHIIAWVKQNNPKAYLKTGERLDKNHQPTADRDCKLGCKKKSNQTPTQQTSVTNKEKRITQYDCDRYFWGYASGVVATKVPGYGEFVLAELTQTFDRDDTTYFLPLMQQVERRLGRKPRFGAFDAAFDAFYVYDYFDEAGGFAAVPFVARAGCRRQFDAQDLPLCEAGLGMPLKSTYLSRKELVPQRVGRHACPLLFPEPTEQTCPIDHKNWAKGGCISRLGTSNGARIRYQLDRQSPAYKQLYNQRTANERVNSQALELGIERPKLRNQQAISNQNTLIYVLINLRAVHRLRRRTN